ncbi:hypothetical protein MRB53_007366 [Persea americana]|uniref:Uncharacterized protein n=1 Tax=Persea americana TaxID=3435 RepID=A0ACC2MJC0_PERAE|nr:hypothetical protein MRB53_007366 [Persea americana]
MACMVDSAFIQASEHRPKVSILEAGGIPLIDLSPLNSSNSNSPEALSGLVAEIGAACKDWGFFQVINHGVPLQLQERIESAARKFFALPLEEKSEVRRDEENPLGYYDKEHTKNVRDWKEVFDFTLEEPTFIPPSHEPQCQELQKLNNQWPHYPPEMREACIEYARGVEKLAYKLLELISLSLNLPADRLKGFFRGQTCFVRLNHYPPCPEPQLALGVGRHKDSGALTILAQDDVGGLEVKRKADGEWLRVKPIPNSYIINVGDIIQVWSNDKYESVEHRVVVNLQKERLSIPFRLNPAFSVMVKPLEELLQEHDPPKYKEYNWGRFFKSKRDSNFKKLVVENVQISHFRVAE